MIPPMKTILTAVVILSLFLVSAPASAGDRREPDRGSDCVEPIEPSIRAQLACTVRMDLVLDCDADGFADDVGYHAPCVGGKTTELYWCFGGRTNDPMPGGYCARVGHHDDRGRFWIERSSAAVNSCGELMVDTTPRCALP